MSQGRTQGRPKCALRWLQKLTHVPLAIVILLVITDVSRTVGLYTDWPGYLLYVESRRAASLLQFSFHLSLAKRQLVRFSQLYKILTVTRIGFGWSYTFYHGFNAYTFCMQQHAVLRLQRSRRDLLRNRTDVVNRWTRNTATSTDTSAALFALSGVRKLWSCWPRLTRLTSERVKVRRAGVRHLHVCNVRHCYIPHRRRKF